MAKLNPSEFKSEIQILIRQKDKSFDSEKMKDMVAQNFHDSTQSFHSNCHSNEYKKYKCKLYIQDDSSSSGSYYGQKVTGLERRKKETKNKRRRRYEHQRLPYHLYHTWIHE